MNENKIKPLCITDIYSGIGEFCRGINFMDTSVNFARIL
jgi:hypothetical protein